MSAYVLLNLLNKLRKRDKMRGLQEKIQRGDISFLFHKLTVHT